MPYSPNPQATLVANVSNALQTAATELNNAAPAVDSALAKAQLDLKVWQAGGGFASENFSGVLDQVQTGMGNVSDTVQSFAQSGNLSTAFDTAGSVARSASSQLGGAVSSTAALSSLAEKVGGNLATGIKTVSGAIAKGAGLINDFLGQKRAANLPPGGELITQTSPGIKITEGAAGDWRVKINIADWGIFDSYIFKTLEETGGVVFPYQPTITFSTKANYEMIEPIHNNYPFMGYKNSQVDEISIQGQFTAETEKDASYWIAATTFFRTVTKMFYGNSDEAGNPPIICLLNGYGSSIFENVPVVVKNFTITLPEDVNYVRCDAFGTLTWVPILSTIQIGVQPIYNRRELRQFSLQDFARGRMTGYL